MRGVFLGALLVAAVAGCAGEAPNPPEAEPRLEVPAVTPVSPDVTAAARSGLPTLARDSAERKAQQLTVRVRNVTCGALLTGSGFAVDKHVLVTNRHVLAGAQSLEVDTWDGRTLHVSSAAVGVLGDLGIAVVDGDLPLPATFGPPASPGDVVTVVGYPLGGPLTLARGVVADRIDGSSLGVPGTVMRLTARVEHGNSGGPVLDERGRVVGIVYAIEVASGFGLAIPVDTLRSLAQQGGLEAVPACGAR